MLGLANGGIVMAIYNGAIPNVASVRVNDQPNDKDVEGARKQAAWTSAAVLGFMFLLTRDRNSFLIGGLVLAGVDIMVKHANGFNPMTGLLHADKDTDNALDQDSANIYPLPDAAEEMASGDY